MIPNPIDFHRICRICLSSSENLLNLFGSSEDVRILLASMTTISMVANDSLPQNICAFCLHQVQSIRYFISKCQESDRKLRSSLQNMKVNCDNDQVGNDIQATNNIDFENDEEFDTLSLCEEETSHRTTFIATSNIKQAENELVQIDSNHSNCTTKCPLNESPTEQLNSHNQEIAAGDEIHVKSDKPFKSNYKCDICNKKFANSVNLQKHKTTHDNEESKPNFHQCTVCGKQMKHINHFKMHMRSHRNLSNLTTNSMILSNDTAEKKKKFLCSTCGKACTSRSNLAVHTRRHTGVMTNFCNICGKGYPRSTDLTIHMRKHTGEKPFSCSICNRSFARSDKLTIHIRVHTGEKPYGCKSCGKAFAQRNDLISHQRRKVCGNVPQKKDSIAK